ncbi:MAG: hypothetical protein JWR29_1916, partial [Tardiphaga sp.]|nr:hypothetical protein [Tardiphaga sp.]
MNKPVIITEDTTMAPVVVEAPVAPPGALGPDDMQTLAPTYAVIFAISLS